MTATALPQEDAGLPAPTPRVAPAFVFRFPWYLLILALVLIWGIYLVLVGIDPVVLSRPADPQYVDVRDFEAFEDMAGYRLGVVAGSGEIERAQRIVPEERLVTLGTFDAGIAALSAGDIDGLMVESFFGLNFARGNAQTAEAHTDNFFADTFNYLRDGFTITLSVTLIAYTSAIFLGLIVGIIRSQPPKPGHGLRGGITAILRLILYQVATLYVAILRGLPILVTLLVSAFAIVPAFREFMFSSFGVDIGRRLFLPAGIIALAVAYGAFLSETFRAGIQSIERGQIEAARSLGMSYIQVIRLVVLPQAIRRVLPPLGNDMIAMIKDTSLVSALGVNDITQLATLWYSTTFRYPDTLFILAIMYLTMTIIGSLIVRSIESRVAIPGR